MEVGGTYHNSTNQPEHVRPRKMRVLGALNLETRVAVGLEKTKTKGWNAPTVGKKIGVEMA
jgi:hypothetical protein